MQKQLIELEVKAKEKAANLIPEIIKMLPKFHGKVANKRLNTALKAIDQNLSFKMEYNSFKISMHIQDRDVVNSEGVWEYINNFEVTIVHDSIISGNGDGICQNGTIDSNRLIEILTSSEKSLRDHIQEITNQLANIDAILNEYKMIKKSIDIFERQTNWIIRSYYDIKFE